MAQNLLLGFHIHRYTVTDLIMRAVTAATCLALAFGQSPSAANCSTLYFDNAIDHFSWRNPGTYKQRYLLCDQYYQPGGIIFFYTGNEGDVTLYANATGLMWENAAEFKALLVFAEHRYYGTSWPQDRQSGRLDFLSSTQALADYAVLLRYIKEELLFNPGIPAIAFGGEVAGHVKSTLTPCYVFGAGSYGGVLSAMFRAKYPGSVVGAIAASAPLRGFPGQVPAWDSSMYYAVVSRTASAAGGATDACRDNVAALWLPMFLDGETTAGRAGLSSAFRTCAPLETPDDVTALALWIRGNWDVLAMGNYPYPSSYMTGGSVKLPAYPVRAACSVLNSPIAPTNKTGLYDAMRIAVSVMANATGDAPCYQIDPNPYTHPAFKVDGQWDYQRCTVGFGTVLKLVVILQH